MPELGFARENDRLDLPAGCRPTGAKHPLSNPAQARVISVNAVALLVEYRSGVTRAARRLTLSHAECAALSTRVTTVNSAVKTRISLVDDGYSYAYSVTMIRPDPMADEDHPSRGLQLHRVTHEYIYPVNPDARLRVLSTDDPAVIKGRDEYDSQLVGTGRFTPCTSRLFYLKSGNDPANIRVHPKTLS